MEVENDEFKSTILDTSSQSSSQSSSSTDNEIEEYYF